MPIASTTLTAPVAGDGPRALPFPDIPFVKYRLANGLTLIVHENHTSPLIAAELLYNVGSKDEPAGRFGFAHLFEHLMFKESANRRGNWHNKIDELGGSNVNGSTSYDWTNYYQTVPTDAIDTLLWMESDRMGHLLEGLSSEVLMAELDVVKNEKKQREGAPLGSLAEIIAGVLYPFGHPYGHTIIGTLEDLCKANLDTARDWYRRWYSPANAILVLAGDIAATDALAKVEHWFGDLPMGEPIRRATRWLPPHQGSQRLLVQDLVSNPGLAKVWIVPAYGDIDTVDLGLLASALTGTPGSILTRRLVEEERLCTAVEASVEQRYLCSEFCISATFATGADGGLVEQIIDAELRQLLERGPSAQDLNQAFRAGRLNFIEAQDSLAVKAGLLAASEMTFGSPDGYRKMDVLCETATPTRVAAAGRRWLSRHWLTIDIRPYFENSFVAPIADRTNPPQRGSVKASKFPAVERAILRNGMRVEFAHRAGSEMVTTLLLVKGGSGGDPAGLEGLSGFTVAQMMAGTTTRDKHAINALQSDLNARITTSAGIDTSGVQCRTLRDTYPDAVRLMAELILEPAFPEPEFSLAKVTTLAALDSEQLSVAATAERACAILAFGPDHMLGRRHGGTSASIATVSRANLRARHTELFRPAAATLFVVGDLALGQVIEPLDLAFGGWRSPGDASSVIEGPFEPRPGRYFVRRNGAAQSAIKGALALTEFGRCNDIGPAMSLFSFIFGEAFGSRLNHNLREERGWTYGAHARFARWPNLGSFNINVSVQADRTIEALAEIEAELAGLALARPITEAELTIAKNALLLEMPSYWTTQDNILGGMTDRDRYGLADDYYDRLGERIAGTSLAEVQEIAECVSDLRAMTFVIAGDPAAFETARLTVVSKNGTADGQI